jgi:hypothetical protein
MMRIGMVSMVTPLYRGAPHAWAHVAAHLRSLKLQNKGVLHCVLHA